MGKKKSSVAPILFGIVALAAIVGGYLAMVVFGKCVSISEGKMNFAIETNSNAEDITNKLEQKLQVGNVMGLQIVAKVLDLENHIHPGMYELTDGMSAFDVVRLFRSGKRKTVDVVITNARHYDEVLQLASTKLEASYEELSDLCRDRDFIDSLGFKRETVICLFVPDTYEFYWNTSARQFIERMAKEYKNFWNEKRLNKAKQIGLTPQEVMTLASIVDQETRHNDEKPKIAGVYMNRLNGNETAGKLQADPTIKFALNDFEIKRVRKGHIERAKSSPYSTYEWKGLPPGPICIPSKAGIDAVLNYEHHNYYYFCAQPNYSGYSNFSSTFAKHLLYATEYQKWLNKEGY
ncbi:MAG: endolytic transglycosylase MltG [Bacteroidales bacterium]|nr:endolytic transglycosylase MltG [Bacteroidales bacterium]